MTCWREFKWTPVKGREGSTALVLTHAGGLTQAGFILMFEGDSPPLLFCFLFFLPPFSGLPGLSLYYERPTNTHTHKHKTRTHTHTHKCRHTQMQTYTHTDTHLLFSRNNPGQPHGGAAVLRNMLDISYIFSSFNCTERYEAMRNT